MYLPYPYLKAYGRTFGVEGGEWPFAYLGRFNTGGKAPAFFEYEDRWEPQPTLTPEKEINVLPIPGIETRFLG